MFNQQLQHRIGEISGLPSWRGNCERPRTEAQWTAQADENGEFAISITAPGDLRDTVTSDAYFAAAGLIAQSGNAAAVSTLVLVQQTSIKIDTLPYLAACLSARYAATLNRTFANRSIPAPGV